MDDWRTSLEDAERKILQAQETQAIELDLKNCSEPIDLSPLSTLTKLQSLNLSNCEKLTDLSPLSELTSLKELYLGGCDQVTSVAALEKITTLRTLDLRFCYQLSELHPLKGLINLQYLQLYGNSAPLECNPIDGMIQNWPILQDLAANNLKTAPIELGSTWAYDNCLHRIQTWQRDLLCGEATTHEIKIFILGNGGAGKTQICQRLRDRPFERNSNSTHGIQLSQIALWPISKDEKGLDANIWDFGGQDIYHGTHTLFMDKRAIYVVAWTPELENDAEYEEHGVAMRNHRLAYWLAMIRSVAGEDAAIIVVQSKCDEQQQRATPPLPQEHNFRHLLTTSSSALTARGIENLLAALHSQAELLQECFGKVRLPASWVAVAERLRQLRDEGRHTLPMEDFEQECRASHADAPPTVVLQYLHRSGTVFWREGLFSNAVILDQQWALDGVYSALDRQRSLPLLRERNGRFTRNTLNALVWHDNHPAEEQELFISLMQQCGICFALDWDEGEYIAVDALPDKQSAADQIEAFWQGSEPQLELWLDYRFLHEGVMKEMLCQIGRRAGRKATYWRYGSCFYDGKLAGVVQLESLPDTDPEQPGAGRIRLTARSSHSELTALAQWLDKLADELIAQCHIEKPILTRQLWPAADAKSAPQHEREESPALQRIQPDVIPRPYVYVSYGWGPENFQMLERLEQVFAQFGYELRYDRRQMKPSDWISRFMDEIGEARHVLVLLDDKYLRSPWCMRELRAIQQTSLGSKQRFLERIVPCIFDGLDLSSGPRRFPYVQHWNKELASYQAMNDEMGPLQMSPETRNEMLYVLDFCHRIDEMLAWITDMLMPWGREEIEKDEFAVIFEVLQRQGFPKACST